MLQVSVLGPNLFNIFTHNVPRIGKAIDLYTDGMGIIATDRNLKMIHIKSRKN